MATAVALHQTEDCMSMYLKSHAATLSQIWCHGLAAVATHSDATFPIRPSWRQPPA